ncbi:MAG: hypothetical protein ABJH82_07930 [Polaribacter sp.]|uniref:hypothetical protein n=1 Tax=Polaribacter sp. TaxID=1920175 RepID=UPI00326579B5
MFWDNVLFASKMGNQLFYNSIFDWTIPNEFDPGHPPFLGFLLAILWKIFGHKLWVSHLLMLPFTIGVFYQLFKFITYFVKQQKKQIFAFLLLIIDPTLSTQFVLVNPEVIIVFFFFLTINGILFKNIRLKFIGLFFLSIISFRSMMLLGGILFFDILNKYLFNKKSLKSILNFRFILVYILSSLPGIIFVSWRLLTKGWLQTHPDSPWASLWKIATPKIFLKNLATLIHRFVDFGRVFLLLFLIISLFFYGKKIITSKKSKQLLLLSFSTIIFIVIAVLISTNAFGHRYFIVSFCSLNVLVFITINNYYFKKKLIYILLFLGLLTGNLWIYPREISQGWDATLAHVPYHKLRIHAIEYLNNNNINISEVASFFPNSTILDNIDLSNNKKSFTKFTGKNKYVLYATVYNLNDEEYLLLDKNYTVLKKFNKNNITITIYILNKT